MRRLIVEEDRLDDYLLASAGLSGVHAGEPPDARALAVAATQGIDIGAKRARQVQASDFKRFDLVLAMDSANRDALKALAPAGTEQKVHLLLDFSPWIGENEIPDPYHGGADGFDAALDLLQLAARGLLESLDQADREWAVPAMPRARLKVSTGT